MKKILLLLAFSLSLFANTETKTELPFEIRAGVNLFSISDTEIDTMGYDVNIQFDMEQKTIPMDLGYAIGYAVASDKGTYQSYSYNIKEELLTLDLFAKLKSGEIVVKPAIIYGRLKETVDSEGLIGYTDYETVYGLGIAFEKENISIYYKYLDIQNTASKNITILGVQYIF